MHATAECCPAGPHWPPREALSPAAWAGWPWQHTASPWPGGGLTSSDGQSGGGREKKMLCGSLGDWKKVTAFKGREMEGEQDTNPIHDIPGQHHLGSVSRILKRDMGYWITLCDAQLTMYFTIIHNSIWCTPNYMYMQYSIYMYSQTTLHIPLFHPALVQILHWLLLPWGRRPREKSSHLHGLHSSTAHPSSLHTIPPSLLTTLTPHSSPSHSSSIVQGHPRRTTEGVSNHILHCHIWQQKSQKPPLTESITTFVVQDIL